MILAALAAALVIGLLSKKEPEDPHKGQVYIYDGFDWIWMTPLEGVPANELTEEFFSSSSGRIEYTGSDYDVLRGVDVSEHQLDIDWKQVAASGVDYAYIRVGGRGYPPRAGFLRTCILNATFRVRSMRDCTLACTCFLRL